jgi:para-nitrobenzyl esterase
VSAERVWQPSSVPRATSEVVGRHGVWHLVQPVVASSARERGAVSAPRLDTVSGTLEGQTVSAPNGRPVERFLGIPYAGSPAGNQRWRRPVPPPPWAGIRSALAFGPTAPQGPGLPSSLPAFRAEATDEDCLTLNVWAPTLNGERPVMVWIHGGAFTSGGSSQAVFDGSRLAVEADAVIVTINYRLGALGFLCPDDAGPATDTVGNAGLHDQLAALAWVRDHSGALGADPSAIMVFGESAGAGSILHLLASTVDPLASRAAAQSGEAWTLSREEASRVAGTLAAALGVDRADASTLRRVPTSALLAAQDRVTLQLFGQTGVMPFAPAVDDDLLDRPVLDGIVSGHEAGVALVIGTTRDELRLFPDPTGPALDDERLARRVARLVPNRDAHDTVAAYRAALGTGVGNGDVWEAVRTDARMRMPAIRLAEARAASGTPAFVYRFDWAAPGIGAAHAVDLPFTFGTFDREGWAPAVGHDPAAEALGARLRRAWAALAATGDPSQDGLPWPPYETPRRAVMVFDRAVSVVDDPDGSVCDCYR